MIRKGTERTSASKAKATRFAHTQMESPVEESDLANIETAVPSNWRKNYEYQEIKTGKQNSRGSISTYLPLRL